MQRQRSVRRPARAPIDRALTSEPCAGMLTISARSLHSSLLIVTASSQSPPRTELRCSAYVRLIGMHGHHAQPQAQRVACPIWIAAACSISCRDAKMKAQPRAMELRQLEPCGCAGTGLHRLLSQQGESTAACNLVHFQHNCF